MQVINSDKVNDPVFSDKAMGDGFAGIPIEEIVGSLISGKVNYFFELAMLSNIEHMKE
ncbi:PTS glucose transporter subunit IIA [Enterococcus sp. PF-2]|uniref:PTS glucose transporter subunit IIA n=1 Tax=unclassified Enterococcus TaxID=2608891 RepID=UPI002159772E|nr:PTS glucose transporter subunit IIA [Enterococcus sp. PF-2]